MKRWLLILVGIVLMYAGIRGIFFSSKLLNDPKNINEAIIRLKKDEEKELVKIKNKIEEEEKKNETKSSIEDYKDVSFFQFYKDTMFLGDSITEGLINYQFVNEYNVMADKGDNVKDAFNKIEKVKQVNPDNLVLFYGMNDVIEFDSLNELLTPSNFKKIYIDLINKVKQDLPNTKIYIISPTNVTDEAINTNYRLKNKNISMFRGIIQEVCNETGVMYIDINSKIIDRSDLYEGDGIHFKYEFYSIWLETLKEGILKGA